MTEYTRQLIYGLKPIKRENPKPGESEWYYVDPRGAESATDMKTIDVPSEFSPNPHAAEIQDYIYEHDKYNYEQLYGDTPPPMSQSVENDATDVSIPESATNDPNCYMTFDGQNLNLYNNDGMVNTLDAQSGQDAFQSAKYQNVANKGPIPEGTYYANQDQRQNITMKDALWGAVTKMLNLPYGGWKGSLPSWGTSRVWLQPDENTNTYGRSGFSIHGGLNKGSAGCIDIPWQTGKLDDYLDECQDSVPVKVKYPKDW